MKACTAALAAIMALALLAPAQPAFSLTIKCWLFSSTVEGDGTVPGTAVTVTLRDSADAVRGIAHAVADAGGEWHAYFENNDVMLLPRDKVHVDIGGSGYDHQLPLITIRSIDPVGNRVTGRIRPRKDQALVYSYSYLLDSTGWTREEFTTAPVDTDAEGRFTIDTGSWGDIRRNAVVYAGYLEPPFAVARVEIAPGLFLLPALGLGYVSGISGRSYEATLLGAGGTVRDISRGTIVRRLGYVEFARPSGMPMRVNAGNRIRVGGLGDFTVKVPPLSSALDAATNIGTVRTLPFRPLELVLDHFNPITGAQISSTIRYVVTNAAGEANFDWAPLDVFVGDTMDVTLMDAQGNRFEASGQALPWPGSGPSPCCCAARPRAPHPRDSRTGSQTGQVSDAPSRGRARSVRRITRHPDRLINRSPAPGGSLELAAACGAGSGDGGDVVLALLASRGIEFRQTFGSTCAPHRTPP